MQALEKTDGWICGPIGHNAYPRNDPTWVMPPIRKRFELFANVKPVKSYPNIPSIHKDVDIVFLRETTEGMMSEQRGARRQRRVPAQRGHRDRHARRHPQGSEPGGARSVRDRPHAQAEDGDRAAQGAGLPAGVRHVRARVPQGGAGIPGRRVQRGADRRVRAQARDEAAAVRRGGDDQPVRRHRDRRGRGARRRARARAGAGRGRDAGDGAGDARLGARHRRPEHRQPLRHDHVRQNALRVARQEARRAEGDAGGAG